MNRLMTAISAFSARSTKGRRPVLVAFSMLVALAIFAVSHRIASHLAAESALLEGVLTETPSAMAIADLFAIVLLCGGLLVVAPAMTAAQVGEERRSGTLDLLRTAPLSPTQLVAGFVAGAPSSLYLLLVGPFALHVVAGLTGGLPLQAMGESIVLLIAGSIALMLLCTLASLSVGREAAGVGGPLILTGLLAIFGLITVGMSTEASSSTWAHLHPAGAISALYRSFAGPYRSAVCNVWCRARFEEPEVASLSLIAPVFAALVYLAGGALLLVATRRALAGETASRLHKMEAIGLFTVAVVAILVPMRIVIDPRSLDQGTAAGSAFALVLPYLACVIGATPSATAYGAGRARALSPASAPLLSALLMLAIGIAIGLLLYGRALLTTFEEAHRSGAMVGFVLLALTAPIYSLYSATRLSGSAARLGFWALVGTHMVLQVPVIASFMHGGNGWSSTLCEAGLALGVLVPSIVMWRQIVTDRRLKARAVC